MGSISIDYPPTQNVRWTAQATGNPHLYKRLKKGEAAFKRFIKEMAVFEEDFKAIPLDATNDTTPHWQQHWFLPMDGMSTYTMVASRKPKTVLEIGSGNSTKFFAHAQRAHSPKTKIISIDPEPRAEIDALCDTIHRARLEDMDLSVFKSLRKGDVLFFDGSHRSFQNSDVTVFFLEVMPLLKPGVIIGIHDIFLPFDYPKGWLKRYYNEQYMLGAHILAQPAADNLICACHYMHMFLNDQMRKQFSDEFWDYLPDRVARFPARLNGFCFWFEK